MHAKFRWMAAGLWATACGPLPPATETTGGETSSTTTATTGDPSTVGPQPTTAEPTTTIGTSATSVTSGPPPKCQSDAECDGFCEYCVEGECYDAVGCCGMVPGPLGELELRCIGYECYADDECGDGEICDDSPGFCTPLTPIPVCDRQPLMLSEIALQGAPSAVALADLDGDAALDLIAVLPAAGLVEVALGDGMGGFGASATFSTGLTEGAQRVAVADFNMDGSPDLALTSQSLPDGELSLLFGQDAVFAAPVKLTIGFAPVQVWAGDFDGDGQADVLTHGDSGLGSIALRLGDGMGGLGPESGMTSQPFGAGVGAVFGDDRLDLVMTVTNLPGVTVSQFDVGVFSTQVTLAGSGSALHGAVAVGDIDGDGVDDVVGHRTSGATTLIQAWPMLASAPEFAVEGSVALGPVADVDGDGRGDLVTAGTEPTTVRVIYLDVPCIQAYGLPAATAPPLLATGDLDGDGKLDVVAGSSEGASAAILRSGL